MATHDYDIANQSGAAFRTDLNNALAAIQSNNSNSSSPATTVAYQWWADTSAGTLKIRNAANNAWIELFQLDGTLTLEDGSASTPALAFRDDLNTGIFSSAADRFNIATAGVERMELGATLTVFNEDGADTDFRIESDTNQNMFKLDASTSRIGIGHGTPTSILHLKDTVAGGDCQLAIEAESGNDAVLLLDTSNGSGATADVRFAMDGTTKGKISFLNAGGTAGAMVFSVGSNSEAIRIDSDGNVAIGTSSPDSDSAHHALTIAGKASTGAGMLSFVDTSGNKDGFIFADNGSLFLSADSSNATADSSIRFRVDGSSEKMRILATGEVGINLTPTSGQGILQLSGGLRIAGSASASDSSAPYIFRTSGANNMVFATSNAERMRIATGGAVTFNASGDVGGGNTGTRIQDPEVGTCRFAVSTTSSDTHIQFLNNSANSVVGSVTTVSNSTAYNTSSDYRLKENVSAISDGITRLKTLKPYRFNFKVEPDKTVDGFFAHEVTAVPEAITGEKDAVAVQADVDKGISDKVGDPIYQQIDQSKLIPLLVAAVQELITKVETLEAA